MTVTLVPKKNKYCYTCSSLGTGREGISYGFEVAQQTFGESLQASWGSETSIIRPFFG